MTSILFFATHINNCFISPFYKGRTNFSIIHHSHIKNYECNVHYVIAEFNSIPLLIHTLHRTTR